MPSHLVSIILYNQFDYTQLLIYLLFVIDSQKSIFSTFFISNLLWMSVFSYFRHFYLQFSNYLQIFCSFTTTNLFLSLNFLLTFTFLFPIFLSLSIFFKIYFLTLVCFYSRFFSCNFQFSFCFYLAFILFSINYSFILFSVKTIFFYFQISLFSNFYRM